MVPNKFYFHPSKEFLKLFDPSYFMHELILLTFIEIIPRKVLGRDILAARREAEKEQNGVGYSSADEGDGERMDTSADYTVNTTATTTGES